ncbi:MAG: type II toxin-antitoxin system VapC family toxin [Tannerella sp.]|jgi:PIN domain nuclease of toxin-antitoxin system|nr:type II toxin-antitoxin system VapC family toxin [Tannerella sp.]
MYRYLLDTNIVLFFLYNQDELDIRVRDIIVNDYKARLYVSMISVQEIIHLYKKNKIKTTWKRAEDILPSIEFNFEILPITREHVLTYSKLSIQELHNDHNDPNDHLIIAQAITERMTLISSDSKFEDYVMQKLDFIFNCR